MARLRTDVEAQVDQGLQAIIRLVVFLNSARQPIAPLGNVALQNKDAQIIDRVDVPINRVASNTR